MTSIPDMSETIVRTPQAAGVLPARTVVGHALLLAGLFVLLSGLYWGAVYAVGGQRGLPLDDAYIHLQYARSIWQGHAFEYNYLTNPGVRSSGTSAPLWTVMLVGAYGLAGDWLTAAYGLGVIWTIPCVALVYWLLYRWTGRASWTLFGATAFVMTHPTVLSAYEGMEPAAYVATFLLGLLFYDFSRTVVPGRQTAWRLAGSAVFAITVWLRPEFLLMPALIGAERAASLRRAGAGWLGRWIGEMVLHAGVWLALIAPYLAFNQWIAGTFLPNTYTVKAIARNADLSILSGLPAAWYFKSWKVVGHCLTIGLPLMILTLGCGLIADNALFAVNLSAAAKRAWRGRWVLPDCWPPSACSCFPWPGRWSIRWGRSRSSCSDISRTLRRSWSCWRLRCWQRESYCRAAARSAGRSWRACWVRSPSTTWRSRASTISTTCR